MFENIEQCISFIETSKRSSTKTLEHMKLLCEIYGNPQDNIKYIHVAGTNGKGSTVSYLREIFYNAGLSVGTFTSPYIECFNERITYNIIISSFYKYFKMNF
jgi:dihydrofolate synthase/folylpolyglutamate synthase